MIVRVLPTEVCADWSVAQNSSTLSSTLIKNLSVIVTLRVVPMLLTKVCKNVTKHSKHFNEMLFIQHLFMYVLIPIMLQTLMGLLVVNINDCLELFGAYPWPVWSNFLSQRSLIPSSPSLYNALEEMVFGSMSFGVYPHLHGFINHIKLQYSCIFIKIV